MRYQQNGCFNGGGPRGSIEVSAQTKDDSFCKRINAIFEFFRECRLKDTAVKYPLSQKRDHSVFAAPRSFIGRTTYYSSAAVLPDEANSEFVFGDENWHYTAVFGPYSREAIDSAGRSIRNKILSCINQSEWTITNIADSYLFMSYKAIDFTISISRREEKGTGKFKVLLGIIRFTPLK